MSEPPRDPGERTFVTHAGAATDARRPGARLRVVEGPDAPLEVAVPPAGLTIGSADDCDVVLADRRVSRRHVHVAPEGSGFRVRDLGSTNGTLLAGERVEDRLVPDGALLQVGRGVLQLVGPDRVVVVPPSERRSFGALLGEALPMREVFGVLERVVSSDASVLIEGETGTGKEVVARALHTLGPRAGGPLVALDCGAMAANLVESELFGHVRGAFTGAIEARAGAFERAHGGILFLDEIGELPLDLQPRLLRALESREVRRLGAGEARHVDVRVLAGTHRDLEAMVQSGAFRADLYYRLAVVRVVLPPLRQRREDLPVLAEKFLREAGVDDPGPIDGPNLEALRAHPWPGNVRELRNAIQRAVACAGTTRVRFGELSIHLGSPRPPASAPGGAGADAASSHLPAPASGGAQPAPPTPPTIDLALPFLEAKERLVDAFERRYLAALLADTGGNVAEAARRSGLNRRHLYDLLKKHGLRE